MHSHKRRLKEPPTPLMRSAGRLVGRPKVGLADSQVAPGPKTIAATSLLSSLTPAAMAGVGTWTSALDVPLQVSLDVGTSLGLRDEHLGDTYQITANVLATNL